MCTAVDIKKVSVITSSSVQLNMLYGITAQLKISNENCIIKLGEIYVTQNQVLQINNKNTTKSVCMLTAYLKH